MTVQRQALQQTGYLGQGHRLGRDIECGEGMEGVTCKVTTTVLTGVSRFVLMGFDLGICYDLLYMCCFYWIMNKAVLANGLAESSHMGNTNRNI